ncbi:hypothetical protein ACIB24_09895 [Spongisporangium articulatum]|uniref:Tat (Twin-arginine translocation) pathway signal sequence n=1 Tax=Spongisporangium articulatum TaxID=3362603 RepID=A0ABW8AMQ2_9ACTN
MIEPTTTRPLGARTPAMLTVAAAALTGAVFLAPQRLAGGGLHDRAQIGAAFRAAVAGYWSSGARNYPPALQHVVDYWLRFHLIKTGVAILLLGVLGVLTVRLWREFARAGGRPRGRRAALGAVGAAVTLSTAFVLAMVMANLQGAVAPFSSLLPMELDKTSDPATTRLLAQARLQLAGSHRVDGYTPPALDVMVGDCARYHVAMAVIAVVLLIASVGLGVLLWRGRARSADRRTRRVIGWAAGFTALPALFAVLLLVANTGVARDPAPALLALFDGGF